MKKTEIAFKMNVFEHVTEDEIKKSYFELIINMCSKQSCYMS